MFDDALNQTRYGGMHYTGEIDFQGSSEIENGYFSGYQMLHGTNSDVGGIQIKGIANKIDARTIEYKVTVTWNDIIDPNGKYEADSWSAWTLDWFYDPLDYEVHISWEHEQTITIPIGYEE